MAAEAGPIEVFFPGDITFDSHKAVGGGGYGDLFKGEHASKGPLALKRLRVQITQEDDPKAVKRAQNAYIAEAGLWRKLHHPHVLTCIGLFHNSWDEIYLVSPWLDDGSLVKFIACHPDADRPQLLRDAAEGLAYLHENDIVHGDVKGVNALVTAEQRVVLCDFGLSKPASSVNTSTGGAGTLRWQSPELLMGGPRTKQADVYPFGILIYQILSGRLPFERYGEGAVVVAVVDRDERPPKNPQQSLKGESYEKIWEIAETCWAKPAEDRPRMTEVVARWPSSGLKPDLSKPAGAKERPNVIENSPSDMVNAERIFKRAEAFHSRLAKNQDAADLEAAIRLYREVLLLSPSGHPKRPNALYHLGRALNERYDLQFDHADLEEAVALLYQAVQLYPLEDPGHDTSLNYLLPCLHKRDGLSNSAPDLEATITILREEMQRRPRGDPGIPGVLHHLGLSLSGVLHHLGLSLSGRYDFTHEISDLEEAITFQREAVQLCPPGSSGQAKILGNLAFYLSKRYNLSSNALDLDEAIKIARETTQLFPSEDPGRGIALNNFGSDLESRYTSEHQLSDLEEAIQSCEEFIKTYGTAHELSLRVNQRLERLLKIRPPIITFKSKLTSKLKALKF